MIKSSRGGGGGGGVGGVSEFQLYRILRAMGSARALGAPSLHTPLGVGQTISIKEFVHLQIQPPQSKIPRFSLASGNSKMYSYHICMNYVHDSV